MMTNKYQSMTDPELDKLGAEMCFNKTSNPANSDNLVSWNNYTHLTDEEFEKMPESKMIFLWDKQWNPSHKDSNQVQNYLFPKFSNTGMKFKIVIDKGLGFFDVYLNDKIIYTKWSVQPDKINRTKLIACLMADDILKEMKND